MSIAGTDIFVLRNDTYIDISNVFDTGQSPSVTTDIYAKGIDIRNLYRFLPLNDPQTANTDIYLNTGKDLSETFAKKKPYITNANIEVLDSTGYYFILFTTSTRSTGTQTGSVTLNGFTNDTQVYYLVIGGGGAGGDFISGNGGGGGGGAGGMLEGLIQVVDAGSTISVSVGDGGISGENGRDSSITYKTNNSDNSITAKGGGRGGTGGNNGEGFDGGSGGGAGYNNTATSSIGEGISGPPRQGNNGRISNNNGGGGGGGAGGAAPSGKNGGIGKIVTTPFSNLTVNNKEFNTIYWAGGGAGGGRKGASATGSQSGGNGGGGSGGVGADGSNNPGQGSSGNTNSFYPSGGSFGANGGNGGTNTGGGGGGAGYQNSDPGNGGSGIVILAIPK